MAAVMTAPPGEGQRLSDQPGFCLPESAYPFNLPPSPACLTGVSREKAGKRKSGAHRLWRQVISGGIDCLVMMLFTAVSAGVILVLGM